MICARSEGVAMLLGKIATGGEAIRTPCRQQGQAYFGRI